MTSGLRVPTPSERLIAEALRSSAVQLIEMSNIDQIAERLSLMPSGVRVLASRSAWDLSTAVRTADLLGIDVIEEIDRLKNSAKTSAA